MADQATCIKGVREGWYSRVERELTAKLYEWKHGVARGKPGHAAAVDVGLIRLRSSPVTHQRGDTKPSGHFAKSREPTFTRNFF